jgi:hypothetical protein
MEGACASGWEKSRCRPSHYFLTGPGADCNEESVMRRAPAPTDSSCARPDSSRLLTPLLDLEVELPGRLSAGCGATPRPRDRPSRGVRACGNIVISFRSINRRNRSLGALSCPRFSRVPHPAFARGGTAAPTFCSIWHRCGASWPSRFQGSVSRESYMKHQRRGHRIVAAASSLQAPERAAPARGFPALSTALSGSSSR